MEDSERRPSLANVRTVSLRKTLARTRLKMNYQLQYQGLMINGK